MKTLQELYNEVIASDELKAAFAEAAKSGKTLDFLKAQGCEATAEEVSAFLAARPKGELSDDELDGVAGGACNAFTGIEAAASVVTMGVLCGVTALASGMGGGVGQDKDNGGRLCSAMYSNIK